MKPRIDEELKSLAEEVLLNAFYVDFSALVNKYLEAAEGLDIDEVEMRIGERTSVYGRDDCAITDDVPVNIWTRGTTQASSCGHHTILSALEYKGATEIHFQGVLVFVKEGGEWVLFEEKL